LLVARLGDVDGWMSRSTNGLESLARACREAGLPVTAQRRLVFETILKLDGHPTADDVHRAAAMRRKSLSRATVYRTLEGLVALGLITKACHPGRVGRYDARTEMHHHLVCMRCSQISDISDPRLDDLPTPDTSVQGFEIIDHRVQLRGICRNCHEKEEQA
jgi:Fur family peroxide stress response transcriptional regulator